MTQLREPRAGRHRGRVGARVQAAGKRYEKPTLVLFTGATQTACGTGQSAMGPLLLSARPQGLHRSCLLPRAQERFHAPGDFAQAYVIAARDRASRAERCSGISDKVQALKQQAMRGGDQARANALPGAHGAAGRLPGRRVGEPQRPGEEPPAAGRRREPASMPRPRSATTRCRSARRARWCRIASPTALAAARALVQEGALETGRMQACDTFDGKGAVTR